MHLFPDDWDYTTVHDRRSLYRSATGGRWVSVSELMPYTTYYVQVNASNTKGFELSNNMHADMPMGRKCAHKYLSMCLFIRIRSDPSLLATFDFFFKTMTNFVFADMLTFLKGHSVSGHYIVTDHTFSELSKRGCHYEFLLNERLTSAVVVVMIY